MSHDIRTPMNAIIGFTSLAITHMDNREQLQDYLKKICISSEHLMSLINDVLDMSRIESGNVKINEAECSIPLMVHDLRSILLSAINAKRLDFFIDTIDVEHEDVICDKLRVNQVLINIASNAIKYTPPGGTVAVKILERPNAPNGFADFEFSVKDTGIGMSEEFQKTIFEPFTQEDSSAFGLPNVTPFAFAAAMPSVCLLCVVSRSCCAIVPKTSIKILFTMSHTHSCPAGQSIIVVGKSNTLSRIPLSLKYCNSFFMSALFLLRRSSDLITSVSPRRKRAVFKAM